MTNTIPLHHISPTSEKSFFDFLEWHKKENEYDASAPHRHQYYEIVFFDEGEGLHEIDFVPHQVKAPAIHFLPVGKVHRVGMNLPYAGFSLLFSAAFFPQESQLLGQMPFFQHQNPYPILSPNEHEYTQIKAWLMEIKAAWQGNPADKWDWIRTHLSLILLQSKRLYHYKGLQIHSHKSEMIQQFLDLIEKHHLEHWLLKQYADNLCISEPYLNVLCKKECSMSASQLIQERMVQAAKRKLVYTSDTVKEIAFSLNFSDPSYFIRFFKKQVGSSPNAYREQILKDM